MVLPIVVVVDGDVDVFDSPEEAAAHIEYDGVDDSSYVAYDAEGRLLAKAHHAGQVILSLAEEEATHAAELEARLRGWLRALGQPEAEDADIDLRDLINACKAPACGPSGCVALLGLAGIALAGAWVAPGGMGRRRVGPDAREQVRDSNRRPTPPANDRPTRPRV